MRFTVLLAAAALSLSACAHEARPAAERATSAAAPTLPTSSAPEVPPTDPLEITQGRGTIAELEALCGKLHPECRHPFLQQLGGPHPCANRGALCRDVDLAGWKPRWACACEQCGTDADCGAGERCSAGVVGCSPDRVPRRCEPVGRAGVAPVGPCLAPPSAAR